MSDNNSDNDCNKKKSIDDVISITNKSETENSSIHEISREMNSKIKKYNEILAVDMIMDNGKEGDTVTKADVNKNFPVYGYYVRKPVWVYYESGGGLNYDSSRNSFVLVVFLIDLIMLTITCGFNIMVFTVEELSEIFENYNLFIMIPALAVMIGLSYAMSCSECTRKMPCNIICLVLAVIAMSLLVACITIKYEFDILMYAFCATAVVVLCCCLLALTPIDFTKWYLYVIVIACSVVAALFVMGLVKAFTGTDMTMLRLVLLIVLTVVNGIMLTIEIQMVLGGRSVELDEDDYALGAYLIYTSVINIFLDIVRVLGILDEM